MARGDELAAGLAAVRERVSRAAEAAGRDAAELTLVVVTKTYPATDVRLLSDLGVREVGESRDQEAAAKAGELTDLDLRWHFVGRLQTNKAKSVARYAGAVHSVDRVPLVESLARGADREQRDVGCFVQVSLDGDTSRGGSLPEDVAAVAAAIDAADRLRLLGVMAVAPLRAEPDPAFARLRVLSTTLRERFAEASAISAGMSGDLEAAVRHGATHLRVGGAVLGERAPNRYRRSEGQ